MSKLDDAAKEIVQALEERTARGTSGYDTLAEVKRVSGNTAWVHIDGGVDETPVNMSIDCKKGDMVRVRVSNGTAFIVGDETRPPTDDTVAIKAETKAVKAQATADNVYGLAEQAEAEASRAKAAADDAQTTANAVHDIAEQAQTDAGIAKQAADTANGLLGDMQDAATQAGTTLTGIYADAETAKTNAQTAITNAQTAITNAGLAQTAASQAKASAQNASEYASRALGDLSTVQSVAETLAWITQHGTMALTSDQQLDPTHVYFVADAQGDYVVGGSHYSIVTEPDVADIATYYELSIDESLNNYVATHLAVDGEGLWLLPDSGGNRVLIATGAGSAYTTAGTYIISKVNNVDTVLAKFLANGQTIYSGDGTEIAHLGYGTGTSSSGTNTSAPYYTLGERERGTKPLRDPYPQYDSTATYEVGDGCVHDSNTYLCKTKISTPEPWTQSHWQNIIGNRSIVEGTFLAASGSSSHAEGDDTVAFGVVSHSEGRSTYAEGDFSHAEGRNTYAGGMGAHSEGYTNSSELVGDHTIGYIRATGQGSHAEGSATLNNEHGRITASGTGAHAEGVLRTTASGDGSHAQGRATTASGNYSHAGGYGTVARGRSQTVIGEYNTPESSSLDQDTRGNYALIIGNGVYPSTSNALTVGWSGDVTASGDIEDGSGNVLSDKADSSSLATVATTGSYSDLIGAPTIPTVNDATLTIQKNGTNVETFTANASSNKTANITVPTQTSDLTNNSGFLTSSDFVIENVLLNDNVTISGSSYGNNSKSVSKTGFTPIGIVGMHLENASSGGTLNTYCMLHSFYLSGSTAYWIVRNTNSSAAKIKVTATILYVKN